MKQIVHAAVSELVSSTSINCVRCHDKTFLNFFRFSMSGGMKSCDDPKRKMGRGKTWIAYLYGLCPTGIYELELTLPI